MSVLLVCHSVGDTSVIEQVVERAKTLSQEKIYILPVGQVAELRLLRGVQGAEVLNLSDWLGLSTLETIENGSLTSAMLETIRGKLCQLNIERALIGTPSLNDAKAPFQIAELIADQLKVALVYNDYLFREEEHTFWNEVRREAAWNARFNFLMPLPKASALVTATNPSLKVETVGHPSLDDAIRIPEPTGAASAAAEDASKTSSVRTALEVADDQSLLFISGSKSVEDDLALLQDLLETLKADPSHANTQVRIGIHPGAPELQTYVDRLLGELGNETWSSVSANVRLIITDRLSDRLELAAAAPKFLLRKNISGDEAAREADGVAGPMPATLLTKTTVDGRPAYFHQNKTPYIDGALSGARQLGLFCEQVAARHKEPAKDREALGVPKDKAVERITTLLLA